MSQQTNPVEELIRRTAHRETFFNVTHQLQCLKRCYNVLHDVTSDTTKSSNQFGQVSPNQQQLNSRTFVLQKLKYALLAQYENCFPLPPPDQCTVLLLFDSNEEAFFEIRLKPKVWPENWPTRMDCGTAGIDVELYSLAIYIKVLEAFNEEQTEAENDETGDVLPEFSQAFVVVNSSGGSCPLLSVVEENGLTRVIVKSEEKEIVINDEEEEEKEEHNVHANKQVNQSASANGHVNISDKQQKNTEEENRMDYNNIFQCEEMTERSREERSSSIPFSYNVNNNSNENSSQLSLSNTVSVKPESTVNSSNSNSIIRKKRPLKSNSRTIFQNQSFPFSPAAFDAATKAPQTRTTNRVFSDASASSIHLSNNRTRRSPVKMNEMTAIVVLFHASSAYLAARAIDVLRCPLCSKTIIKRYMTDHLNAVHLRRRYHCDWPGCSKAFSYLNISQKHLRQEHQSKEYERYLQCRD